MKVKFLVLKAFVFVLILNLLTSCNKDDEEEISTVYPPGVIILNEGGFQNSNASLSFYAYNGGQVYNNLFEQNAGFPLGDVAQSIEVEGETGYIVVNNSNKVEVIDIRTFESHGTISGLSLPRYIEVIGDKGYVTEYVDYGSPGRVSEIDLTTNSVSGSVEAGNLPEQIVHVDGKLFVAESDDNIVSVINPSDLTITRNIEVLPGPSEIVIDDNNYLWILSSGRKAYNQDYTIDEENSEPGGITVVNTSGDIIEQSTFEDATANASNLTLDEERQVFYYVYDNAVYSKRLGGSASMIIDEGYYGLGYGAESGYLYGGKATFIDNDWVYRFTTDGSVVDSFQVGIGPNGFVFR